MKNIILIISVIFISIKNVYSLNYNDNNSNTIPVRNRNIGSTLSINNNKSNIYFITYNYYDNKVTNNINNNYHNIQNRRIIPRIYPSLKTYFERWRLTHPVQSRLQKRMLAASAPISYPSLKLSFERWRLARLLKLRKENASTSVSTSKVSVNPILEKSHSSPTLTLKEIN